MPSLFQQGQCDVIYTNTNSVDSLKARGVDIEFVKPESGAIAFFTTMHITKGAENRRTPTSTSTPSSATSAGRADEVAGLLLPVHKDVALAGNLPIKSLDELSQFVTHDWSKINPLRAAWIERFNKEVAK